MREIWQDLLNWQQQGKKMALATVVKVSGSSLRPEGSKLLMSSDREISGSVTGGCVEGAVFEEAREVMRSSEPRLLQFGVSDAQAWEVGLSCGGSVEIFVESLDTPSWKAVQPALAESLKKNKAAILATVVKGAGLGNKLISQNCSTQSGSLGSEDLETAYFETLPANWRTSSPRLIELPNAITVFADILLPPPRLVIVGASHIAIPLVTLAKALDYRTIVVDARSAFATRERFPQADELIVDWPADVLKRLELDAATCVVTLSHDDKLDNPSLLYAITSPARYIGALGSRKTHEKRLAALQEEGASAEDLKRIHAPVGLKIGSRSPAEIALSIMAEIVADAHGVVHA